MSDETPEPTTLEAPPRRNRLAALDTWRGMIMIFMALDHAAAFIGVKPDPEGLVVFGQAPMRPEFPGVVEWFTRFITHYCAPGFLFLAGTSVVLMADSRAARGRSQLSITGHIALRGLLLIAFEYTIVFWGWGAAMQIPFFTVLAAIGACMFLGSMLRFAPATVAWILGVSLLFGYPFLNDAEVFPPIDSLSAPARALLLSTEVINDFKVIYPILPWFAVFLMGMAWGKHVRANAERTMRWSIALGIAMLAMWAALRLTDGFSFLDEATEGWVPAIGNFTPFIPERGWMDFFTMSKYPPAADFVLWALGGSLVFCWAITRNGIAESRWLAPVRVLGRTALFFYLIHLYVYRFIANAMIDFQPEFQQNIAAVWLCWPIGLVLLWPMCAVFAWLKRRFPGFPLDLI